MSVVFIDETEQRDGSVKWADKTMVREYDRELIIITDDPRNDATVVLQVCPRLLSFHPSDGQAYLETIEPKQDDGENCTWRVKLHYTTHIDATEDQQDQQQNQQPDDPVADTHEPTTYSYSLRSRRMGLERDFAKELDGDPDPQPVINSADSPLDPPLEIDVYNQVITIEKDVDDFDSTSAWRFAGWCNDEVYTVNGVNYPAYSLRIVDWSGVQQQEGALLFYRQRVELEAQYPDWSLQVLDKGKVEIKNDGMYNSLSGSVDAGGIPLTGPVLLTANGVRAAVAAIPHYLTFYPYDRTDFNGFDFQ